MTDNLANLAKSGRLKVEAYSAIEFKGLVTSAGKRLADARNEALSEESRFDLAYNACHSLALAALRRRGYRAENRAVVFQVLEQTVGMPAAKWRVLSKCHDLRNLAEYEGHSDVDTRLLADLIGIANELEALVIALG
ncbi:MAG TPA: hypothetical protein VFA91_12305 [Candidatus Polarisedimenticolia bacterium]|nr:hypothetical protein [Candidatus Polarisedimenticolia bacterium]